MDLGFAVNLERRSAACERQLFVPRGDMSDGKTEQTPAASSRASRRASSEFRYTSA